ncbi:N-acetylmuramoyl-L-alanine amidase [Paenibacillus kobensis]|uniref:N-acetylmuramoyl-L-alanine amidase n=1 Tax=Paenibacillus kobensis TaxID=59841 RepID=UPI0013E3AD66
MLAVCTAPYSNMTYAANSPASPGSERQTTTETAGSIAGRQHREAPPHYKRALPSAVVLIDAGHGGIDGGTNIGNILEKDINLEVGKKLYALLRSQGIRAVLNRTGDYALSDDNRWHMSRSRHRRDLSQRRQLTDEIETTLFVSLHVNWAKNSVKHGPLVLHQNSGESALLAFCIQDALNRLQHTNEQPRYAKPFYLLNTVNEPAVIVEMGFLSHAGDREMLTNRVAQTRIAQSISAALWQYLLIAGTPDKVGQLDDNRILP